MRILVHDFSGHPFQMQLSRELARRGHDVLHVDCASYSRPEKATSACTTTTTSCPCGRSISVCRSRSTPSTVASCRRLKYGREDSCVSRRRSDPMSSSRATIRCFAKWYAGRWCRAHFDAVGLLAAGHLQRRDGQCGRAHPGRRRAHCRGLPRDRAALTEVGRRGRADQLRLPAAARRRGMSIPPSVS